MAVIIELLLVFSFDILPLILQSPSRFNLYFPFHCQLTILLYNPLDMTTFHLLSYHLFLIGGFCSLDREFTSLLLHTLPHGGHTYPQLTVPTANPVVSFRHIATPILHKAKKSPATRILLLQGIINQITNSI